MFPNPCYESGLAQSLDDIQNSRDLLYVVKNGVVYSSDTLDEIWPKPSTFPPFFWQKEDAEVQNLPH